MFEKTLSDLVRGIRSSHNRDTNLFISKCIAEIKEKEIKSTDQYTKANALQKLTFLQMMGYCMSPWASFACVEIMSAPRFGHRRIGYLAANQSFNSKDCGDVIILCTNLIQKELRKVIIDPSAMYDAGLALNCLSNIVTRDLAQDLIGDTTNLLKHPRPYIRKKAVLCLFKIFVKYPEGLRLSFNNIKDILLNDPDPSVVSCAVNVIAELSHKSDARNYLLLAPQFFQLLTTSSNNWMLIKVIKLLGGLVKEEPRLARKLLDPLAGIVKNTQAKSLSYEAVHAICLALPYARKSDGSMPSSVPSIVQLCANNMKLFVENDDQNLRYLGLVGFAELMKSNPQAVIEHRNLILKCLSEEDVSIRSRALSILGGMVTRKNLIELINQLIKHVDRAEGAYRDEIVKQIIEMCRFEKYARVSDFEWYYSILMALCEVQGTAHTDIIASQLIDVSVRVVSVREYAISRLLYFLVDHQKKIDEFALVSASPETLRSAVWIVGEFSSFIEKESVSRTITSTFENCIGAYHATINAMMSLSGQKYDEGTQSVMVQSALKVFSHCCLSASATDLEVEKCVRLIGEKLPYWMEVADLEVQERSSSFYQFMSSFDIIQKSGGSIPMAESKAETYSNGALSNGFSASVFEGDLLGFPSMSAETKTAPVIDNFTGSLSVSAEQGTNLVSRCRSFGSILKQTIISEPLKPVSKQAQNRIEIPSSVGTESFPIDLSSFDDLAYADEHQYEFEHISFTSLDAPQLRSFGNTTENVSAGNSVQSSSYVRNGDDSANQPFYIGKSKEPSKVPDNHSEEFSERFGAIKLGDFDYDDGKKSKKKKKKTKKNEEILLVQMSDDEDEKNEQSVPMKKRSEFDALAKVDLTMPLRDDEVMPSRQHHIVVSKPKVDPQPENIEKEKKAKKKKKKNKVAKKVDVSAEDTADLLDLGLGGFSPAQPVPTTNTFMETNVIKSNGGIHIPTANAMGPSIVGSISNSQSKSYSKRPWINAASKASKAKGIIAEADKILLQFKVYPGPIGEQNSSVLLSLRVVNGSSHMLRNLNLSIEGIPTLSFGTVSPDEVNENISGEKVGPLDVGRTASKDVKCILKASEVEIPFKLVLPVSSLLVPTSNMNLMNFQAELSSPGFHKKSCKLQFSVAKNNSKAVKSLSTFLKAETINYAETSLMGLSCYHSVNNAPVRIVVKFADDNGSPAAKLDIFSTIESLAKDISSDLKRVAF